MGHSRKTAKEMAIIDFGYEPLYYEDDYKSFMAAVRGYEGDLIGHAAEKKLDNQFEDGKGKRFRRKKAERFNPLNQLMKEKFK